jgi:phosphoribosyl 1,2-cyclic phosphate phosphodiesterase
LAVIAPSHTVIVDTGPSFREQLVAQSVSDSVFINNINEILYTHPHSDHINGVEYLGQIPREKGCPLSIYGDVSCLQEITDMRFRHLFGGPSPKLMANVIKPYEPLKLRMLNILPVEMDHVVCKSLGYRFGDVAYCTDMRSMEERAIEALRGIKTLIVDGTGIARDVDVFNHARWDYLVELRDRTGAQDVVFTHLPNWLCYETLSRELPQGFRAAYDGLTIGFTPS